MAKKLISCLIALTLVLGMVALNVSAGGPKLTIKASNEAVKVGEDVTVKISITSSDVSYFAFNVEWDKTLLTYKDNTLKVSTSINDTKMSLTSDGYIKYQSLRDGNAEEEFDDTVFLEITFTANDLGTLPTAQSPIDVVLWSNDDEGYCDKGFDPMDVAYVADVDGTVSIVKEDHAAPEVTVAIDGSGKVGEALTANVVTVDNWGLVPSYEYSWTIGGVEVSDTATYTPVAADLGKTITLTVTATVAAEENPTTTASASLAHPAPTVTAEILGNGEVGKDLTASVSAVDAWDMTCDLTYSWTIDGNEVSNTGTYRPKQADLGKTITLSVTATVDAEENATKTVTDTIDVIANSAGAHTAPAVTVAIDGSGKVGEVLTADVNTVDNWGLTPDYTYSWTIDGNEVSNTATYTPVAADLGKTITLTVTATVDVYAEENPTTTASASLAHPAPTVTADIVGDGMVGKDLTASINVVDAWDIPYDVTYSWTIDGNEVRKDAPYAPTKADLGKTITLTVTATVDAEENATKTVTATIDVIKNTADDYNTPEVAPATVENATTDNNGDSVIGSTKDIVIDYECEDKNGTAYDPEIKVYLNDGTTETELVKDTDYTVDTVNGQIIIPANNNYAGKKIRVEITALDPATGTPVPGAAPVVANISVTKAGGSKSSGGGASLVKKDTEKECIIMTIDDVNIWKFTEWVVNDVPPIIVNDRTMLPSRFVAEALGAKVDWDDATKTVTIVKGKISIILVIGSNIAIINGEEVEFDSPAFIQNDRTYTPTRLVAEALGATVDWDEATRKVTITK